MVAAIGSQEQNRNPYIIVLVDGDGTIVRTPVCSFCLSYDDPTLTARPHSSTKNIYDKVSKAVKRQRMPSEMLLWNNAPIYQTTSKL